MNRILHNLWLHLCVVIFTSQTPSMAQEWTRFRGPNGTGESEVTSLPASWKDSDYNWKVQLPGGGHSSPVLWGDKLFTMSADRESGVRYVLCYDATNGQKLWEKKFPLKVHQVHDQSSFASGTPAVESDFVYFAWADPASITMIAFTHNGEKVWERNLGAWSSQHGFGTSPMIYQHLVILSNSQEGKNGPAPACAVIALDRVTGRDVWSTPRSSSNTSYSVPAVFRPKKGNPELVISNTGDGVFALDPLSGKPIWSVPVMDKRTVSSPLVKDDMIFASNGSGGGGNYLVAIHSDGKSAELKYKVTAQAPYVPTSVARGDLLFMMSDNGIAACLDLKSGDVHWRERIGGNYSSSLVRAHDKVYCTASDGEIVVLAADKEYKLLGRTSLGEVARSTPAIANGKMYLRSFSHLMSLGGGSDAATGGN